MEHPRHFLAQGCVFTFKVGACWPYKCHYWARRPICEVSQRLSLDLDSVAWFPPPICTPHLRKRFCFWRYSFEVQLPWCPSLLWRFRPGVDGTWSPRQCQWELVPGFPIVLGKWSVLCPGDQGLPGTQSLLVESRLKQADYSGFKIVATGQVHCPCRCSGRCSCLLLEQIDRRRPNLSEAEMPSWCASKC